MRAEAVQTLLARTGTSWQVVEWLLQRGDLVSTGYENHTFYLRRFAPKGEGST